MADLGRDPVAEVCGIFLSDGRNAVAVMRSACASGDAGAVARRAHRLKSASGFLGAAGVGALCRQIEELAATGRLDEVPARLDALATELELAAEAVDELARGGGPGTGGPDS